MTELIKIEDVSFKYFNQNILKNINFNVNKGEIIGLIGINGSGKTTLLKCLNGLNKYTSGSITIKNNILKLMSPNKIAKEVAFMNQNTSLDISFNCLDIVVMGRYPHLERGKSFSKFDYEQSLKYMKETDTLKFKDKKINSLSGGERQRVLFSKVVAQETDVILLDEPTASMDLFNQEELFKICKKLSREKKGIVISTHDLRVAAKYCDKLLLLKDGEKVSFGKVEDVLTKKNIKKAYGVDVEIFINPISKNLDYYIY